MQAVGYCESESAEVRERLAIGRQSRFLADGLDEHRLDPRPAGRAGFYPEVPGAAGKPRRFGTLRPAGVPGRGWRAGQSAGGNLAAAGLPGPCGPGRTCGAPRARRERGIKPQKGFSPYLLLGSANRKNRQQGDATSSRTRADTLYVWGCSAGHLE